MHCSLTSCSCYIPLPSLLLSPGYCQKSLWAYAAGWGSWPNLISLCSHKPVSYLRGPSHVPSLAGCLHEGHVSISNCATLFTIPQSTGLPSKTWTCSALPVSPADVTITPLFWYWNCIFNLGTSERFLAASLSIAFLSSCEEIFHRNPK